MGGGVWERLIRSVKRSLRKSIGRSNLTYEQLSTLIVEVEAIINSRPLTYIADDCDGISGCLSPSHLINGRRIGTMPNSEHFEVISTHHTLTNKLKHHRHLLYQFTKQWRRDYLMNLRENHSLSVKKGGRDSVKVGDIVVLKNDTTKRMFWKVAIVSELLLGTDNKIRAAVVKVMDPRGGHNMLRRSIKHLYPIEVRQEEGFQSRHDDVSSVPQSRQGDVSSIPQADGVSSPRGHNDQNSDLVSDTLTQRPRRQAAIIGEQIRRNYYYK